MIKVKRGEYTFTFNDGVSKEDRLAAIDKYMEKQHFRRQLIMRKSDGTETHLGQGVRLHGKRHTS